MDGQLQLQEAAVGGVAEPQLVGQLTPLCAGQPLQAATADSADQLSAGVDAHDGRADAVGRLDERLVVTDVRPSLLPVARRQELLEGEVAIVVPIDLVLVERLRLLHSQEEGHAPGR